MMMWILADEFAVRLVRRERSVSEALMKERSGRVDSWVQCAEDACWPPERKRALGFGDLNGEMLGCQGQRYYLSRMTHNQIQIEVGPGLGRWR